MVLFVTKFLYPRIKVELVSWSFGIHNRLLQLVESPCYQLVVSLNQCFVKSLKHSAHYHVQQLLCQILNSQMNILEKSWRPSNLPKTLSFEFDVFMYVLVFVHLPPIKKHNDPPFLHFLLARSGTLIRSIMLGFNSFKRCCSEAKLWSDVKFSMLLKKLYRWFLVFECYFFVSHFLGVWTLMWLVYLGCGVGMFCLWRKRRKSL